MARAADLASIQYVIAVHESRWLEFWQHAPFVMGPNVPILNGRPFERVVAVEWEGPHSIIVVKNTGRDCAVDQINVAAAAAEGAILSGAHDDLYPPERWDSLVLCAPTCGPGDPYGLAESEFVIRCGSGSPRDVSLTIAGFMSRKRYQRYGYALNPAFESMYADDFFDWQLRKDESAGLVQVIERPDMVFEHRHPILGKGQSDEHYDAQNRPDAYKQGFATFKKLTEGTRVLAVCLPGEVFRHEWVASAFALLNYLTTGPRFIVGNHWCHTTNVYSTRIELANSVLTAAPKSDLVLWIDDDNILDPGQFEMLLQDLEEHPELSGVVGWCWCDTGGEVNKPFVMSCGRQSVGGFGEGMACKRFTLEDFNRAAASGKMLITSDDIAPDAFWSGFPVVLMRGSTLEALGWRAFLPILRDDLKWSFTSEDTSFFYRAHEAGLKFAVDLRVKVPHLKVRAIEPQYLPESERVKVEETHGKRLVRSLEKVASV
jgi:hypothetical protein